MSLNADALAYLAAKGLSMEEVIEFARLQERRVDPTATERKRRQRARDMSHRDVTRDNDIPPSLSRPPNENISNPPTHTHPDIISRTRKGGFSAPNEVSEEQWAAFTGQRKKRLSERAYTLVCNKLEALARDGWPPGEMIDLAVERGWETVFAPSNSKGNGNADNRNGGPSAGQSGGRRPDAWQSVLRGVADGSSGGATDSGGMPGP